MTLKIIAPSETLLVENLVLTLYSAPGWGKTSLACSADKSLLLDADKGSHRAVGVGSRVIINTWSDVVGLTAADLTPYNTVFIDTGGTLITKLMAHLIAEDPKNAGSYGGMSGKGWGNVNSAIDLLLSKIIVAKKDVVIVCHMEEQSNITLNLHLQIQVTKMLFGFLVILQKPPLTLIVDYLQEWLLVRP